jgi:type I restriction-modification system DNA methylase subunit/SOS-response transcriptional repressor LexA
MPTDHRAKLATIKRFDQLIAYLRDEMGWPIGRDSFEAVDDLFYEFTADELGIDPKTAAKIQKIKRLRPLSPKQPWGIFFVKFEPKRLPVVALRRILGQVALKKRASANNAERAAWAADDLLFVSNYGEGDERQISFAHFARAHDGHDLPTLKVLGWDNLDTALHLDAVARELTAHLAWPDDDANAEAWRTRWRAAFTLGHREVVTTSKELSIRLAELARAIRDRIKTALAIETDKGPLTRLMKAFQTALVHDLDADGFADMYAQTIAYGLLSARIADPSKKTADDFAAHMRTNPFLRELMETFLKVGGRKGKAGGQGKNDGIDFDELGVSEVVELLDAANMEAVVRDFGDRNPQEDPVIHFYELFLKEYDAKKRMSRGVFYTPRPVVSYIVRSVDELLRTEFGLADGLADTTTWGEMAKRHQDLKVPEGVSPGQDFVQILDPATGTGTFLVEVIELIHKTLVAKWKAQGHGDKKIDALWNEYVPKHLLTRLHGYELLMAPYAIAHLKIGLKLYETGYRFGSDERARVYLTNALEPAQDFSGRFEFAIPALAREADAVNEVKRAAQFTTVIGNPPYAGHSLNNQVAWIVDKVYDYKRGYPDLQKPGQAKWLQDDYVKFLRFAEWQIERTICGTIGFITNHAWLDNPTFKGMRRHFLDGFDQVSVLDLHGNANKQERAADGSPDKNVFEIKQGVAVSLLRRTPEKLAPTARLVHRSDLFGSESFKYETLAARTAMALPAVRFRPLPPELVFAKLDGDRKREYDAFVSIPQLMGENGDPAPGIVTTHDEFAVSFSKEEQIQKVEALLATRTESEARKLYTLCSQNQWVYADAKRSLRAEDWRKELVPVLYRPFDKRWTVYSRYVAVHRRERVSKHMLGEVNVGLSIPRATEIRRGWEHVFCSRELIQHHTVSLKEVNYLFPLWLEPEWPETRRLPNLSTSALCQLATSTGLALAQQSENEKRDGRGDLKSTFGPRDVFDFVYALLHSNQYRERYADFLKSDFARVPLTPPKAGFQALVTLGTELVALHLLESSKLDRPITEYIGGRAPGVERVSWSKNTVWLDKAQTVGFKGVREDVWNFHIGGYQVCEKWLKDRKGRTLSKDDIAHYQKIVVALSETIRLMKEIDQVIEQHGGWPGAFQTGGAEAAPGKVIPFRPRTVDPKPAERYVTCVPLVPLKAAAGAFSDPQHIEDDGFEWVAVESRHRLRKGMFVAQVVGKSMEPAIPDGAFCLFRAPVEGTRQGKTVLVQLRDATDPETGQRYTVKRYESEKAAKGDAWRHERITLKPVNPDFEPIVLIDRDEGEVKLIADLVEVVRIEA